jgi:hypothetical protein
MRKGLIPNGAGGGSRTRDLLITKPVWGVLDAAHHGFTVKPTGTRGKRTRAKAGKTKNEGRRAA